MTTYATTADVESHLQGALNMIRNSEPQSLAQVCWPLNPTNLVPLFQGRPEIMLMSPGDFSAIRAFCRDFLEEEVRVELVQAGLRGILMGAMVLTSKDLPRGEFFLLKDGKYTRVSIN